jgi:TPR repeat protein
MRIENQDVLSDRLEEVVKALAFDERYKESLNFLTGFLDEFELYDFEEAKEHLADGLHDADGAYPMHPEVAKLIIDIYDDGVDAGNADFMCNLGALYYSGRAGEQSYEKAAYYYEKADKAGNRQATENLGYIYYYGRTGVKDYEKAFKCFVKSALCGYICSLYKVGDFYKNGYYVDKDPEEAFTIYSQCYKMMTDDDLPHVGADVYMRLGDCLYKGFGVKKDLIAALHFMSLAEGFFYQRLMDGDFYQKRNLEHVHDVLARIREEIDTELLPDYSWTGYYK